jgi:hypothetical protein
MLAMADVTRVRSLFLSLMRSVPLDGWTTLCAPFTCWWITGLFPVGGHCGEAAVTNLVQVFLWTRALIFLGQLPGVDFLCERLRATDHDAMLTPCPWTFCLWCDSRPLATQ